MTIKDLIPHLRRKKILPIQKQNGDPFESLQTEMNRVFENFSRGFFGDAPFSSDLTAVNNWGGFSPPADVQESGEDVVVTVELPGIDERDVHVSISQRELLIRGEKKMEKEEKEKEWYRMERSYGSFERSVTLPDQVDDSKAEATFKKGVLRVTIPKRLEADTRAVKRIAVKCD